MMSLRITLVVAALIVLAHPVAGQEQSLEIKGRILDESSLESLPGVTIQDTNTGKGAISNEHGEFSIEFSEFPLSLTISHLGYRKDSITVESREDYSKNVAGKTVIILLRRDLLQLDEIVISGAATKLFAEEPFAIMDYVLRDDRFIALGYRNYNPLKRVVMIANTYGKVISTSEFPESEELFQSCNGEIYLISQDSVTQVQIKNDSASYLQVFEPNFFEEFVRPIQVADDQRIIYLSQSKNHQYHDYNYFNIYTLERAAFYRVGEMADERAVVNIDQRVRSEFVGKINRAWIGPGEMLLINGRIAKLQNEINTEYRPVASAMIQISDRILLFDFHKKKLLCFDNYLAELWSRDIQIDVDKDFTGRVLYDKITNRIFLEFINIQVSYLIEIDPLTGKGLSRIPIPNYKHIERITIHNNRVYFLYQPDFGDRGKKLYFFNL